MSMRALPHSSQNGPNLDASEYPQPLASASASRGPIQQLPAELLGEIFLWCGNGEPAPWAPGGTIEWVLAQVCSVWRVLALSMPALWRKIYIMHGYSVYDNLPIEKLQKALSLHLKRAGNTPLLVSFTTIDLNVDERDNMRNEQRAFIIESLLAVADRWEQAELQLTATEMHNVLFSPSAPSFPLLKALEFSYIGRPSDSSGGRGIMQFKHIHKASIAPNLRHLGYSGGAAPISLRGLQTQFQSLSLPWSRITSLSLENYPSWRGKLQNAIAILRLGHALEDLRLADFLPQVGRVDSNDIVSLDKLKSLTFHASNSVLLSHLRAPNLGYLSLDQLFNPHTHLNVLDLLSQTTKLTHLIISDTNIPFDALIRMLELAPGLHVLVLRDLVKSVDSELVAALTCDIMPKLEQLEITGRFSLAAAHPLVKLVQSRAGRLRHVKFTGLTLPQELYSQLKDSGFANLL
ncbi:F-box domain-containing protein [Mycena indigotica]|uniref:F-box domain-containing protein n=1 Tax=Mycena indigotica TaxID=2126181 RepID=A0A8H6T816_9AGAR|nr:F-box domain-containing protein [Mycena indigotica]KAF7312621.1 F-box domain-containing protein [Mycena indigotica]